MKDIYAKLQSLSKKLGAIGAYAIFNATSEVNVNVNGGGGGGGSYNGGAGGQNVDSLFATLWHIGDLVIYALIGLAVIYIIWNAVKLATSEGADSRKEYQHTIIWGIVGLAVILSIWGLVNIIGGTFGLGNANGGQLDSSQDFQSLMLTK